MRKIEREMIQAIIERRNFKKGNTEVIKKSDYMGIYLHGNLIAKYGIEDSRGLKNQTLRLVNQYHQITLKCDYKICCWRFIRYLSRGF